MSRGQRINTTNLNIRINPELMSLINTEAKADGLKASRLIRDCLVKELQGRGYHIDQIIPVRKVKPKQKPKTLAQKAAEKEPMGFLD